MFGEHSVQRTLCSANTALLPAFGERGVQRTLRSPNTTSPPRRASLEIQATSTLGERNVQQTLHSPNMPPPPPKGLCLRSCAVSIEPLTYPVRIEVLALPAFGEHSVQRTLCLPNTSPPRKGDISVAFLWKSRPPQRSANTMFSEHRARRTRVPPTGKQNLILLPAFGERSVQRTLRSPNTTPPPKGFASEPAQSP